jgi:hypothetical protein
MTLRSADFESAASASSTIPALHYKCFITNYLRHSSGLHVKARKAALTMMGEAFVRSHFSIAQTLGCCQPVSSAKMGIVGGYRVGFASQQLIGGRSCAASIGCGNRLFVPVNCSKTFPLGLKPHCFYWHYWHG